MTKIRFELTAADKGIIKRCATVEEAEAYLEGKEILATRLPKRIQGPILVRLAQGWVEVAGGEQ